MADQPAHALTRPRPILDRAAVLFLLTVLGHALVLAFGSDVADDFEAWVYVAVGLLDAGALFGLWRWSEPQVTPVKDPRDDQGRRLEPIDVEHAEVPVPPVAITIELDGRQLGQAIIDTRKASAGAAGSEVDPASGGRLVFGDAEWHVSTQQRT